MDSPSTTSVRPKDFTIRKIAAFDARLQCYTPQYTFLLGYILTNIFLFFYAAVPEYSQWPNHSFRAWFISIARGFGYLLNFNIPLQFILASQHLLTYLRRTPLSLLFPLDQAMPDLHIIVGITSFVAAILHSFFHLVPGLRANKWSTAFGKWTHLFVTGLLLFIVFTTMVVTSTPLVKKKSFEVFSVVHLIGTAILLSLLIFHGLHEGHLSTYKWILGPALLYFLDRISVMMSVKKASVKVKVGSECKHLIYEGGTVRLCFKKPFEYRAGQYAQLCVPIISKTQWHPFTFASAPHEENVLFFIKQKGDWTSKLHDICKRGLERWRRRKLRFEVKIRGPYGSPAQHAAQYDKVLLISGGVGATPFCSLTKEMTNDFLKMMEQDTTNSSERFSNPSDDELDMEYRSNTSSNEPVYDLSNAGRTAFPNVFPQSQRKNSLGSAASAIFINSSSRRSRRDDGPDNHERHVPSQGWAQFFYTISSTSTFNTGMLWILMIRLFINLMSIAFGYSDLARQGSEILRSTLVRVLDFILALLFLLGLVFAMVSELVSESRFFAEEALISIPLAVVPVGLGIMPWFGLQIAGGKLTLFYFIIIWPMTILLFLLRYLRSQGERALLSGTVKRVHDPCRSVDFIWTTRTREEDVWLVEELGETVGKTRFVRLHRFITREDGDVEDFDTRHRNLVCHFGRPNWDDIFKRLTWNVRNGSTVGIFFCGPSEMAGAVKQAATLSMFDSRYRGIRSNREEGWDVPEGDERDEDSLARSFNVRYVFRPEKF